MTDAEADRVAAARRDLKTATAATTTVQRRFRAGALVSSQVEYDAAVQDAATPDQPPPQPGDPTD